jgi:hypothetical protein
MHPFFSYENLVSLVEPMEPGLPCFIDHLFYMGGPEQVNIFLIGINHATSVYPKTGITIDYWI